MSQLDVKYMTLYVKDLNNGIFNNSLKCYMLLWHIVIDMF